MGGWTKLLKFVIPTNVFGFIDLRASAASSLFFLSVSALFSLAASQYRFIFAASRSLVLASSRSRSQPDKILCKPRESGADLQRATLYCTLALSSQVHSHCRRVRCFKTKRAKCTNTLNIFSSIIPWSYSQEIEVLFYVIFLRSKAIIWQLPKISFEIWKCR